MLYKPARKIRARRGRIYRGKEPFLKNNQMVHWEGTLELDYIRLADFDLEIEEIYYQPICIYYFYGGKQKKYFPDFKVVTSNSDVYLIEVKPKSKIVLEDNQIKFIVGQEFCKKMGWTYLVQTENEIRRGHLQYNLLYLRRYACHVFHKEIADLIVKTLNR